MAENDGKRRGESITENVNDGLAGGESTLSMPSGNCAPNPQTIGTWGQFRLLEKVGHGSFGEVYRAFDTVLEREVALKLLLSGIVPQGEEASALQEARALAKVRHPNVLAVYGVAKHEGRAGFWSDLVHGKTLSDLLGVQGPFGPREVALIGIDVAKALSAVHAAHLLHRDIKASNVMREEGGRILLMDFGLTHRKEASGQISGTLPYLAPELLRGQPASVASDIYAVGVLLYYLLAGKHPFEENSLTTLKAAHESSARPRLMNDRPDLPEPLTRVVETAMEPDPGKRYASAGEMISALSAAAELSATHRPAPRNRRWLWLIAAAVLIPVGLYFFGAFRKTLPAGTAQQDYLKAQDLLDRYYKPHNIENAISLFQKAAKQDPTLASAYAGLGRALWSKYRETHDLNSLELAKIACRRALELDHDNASAHVTSGMIYTGAARTDLAAEELKEALRLNSRSADAYSALAELYQKQGRAADVEPTIQKAIDLAPGAWLYVNQLGTYYLSKGNYAGAAREFQQATALNPDNAHAWNNLGLAYRRQNRLAEAQAAYEKSLTMEAAFSPLSNLGTILELRGNHAEAVQVFTRAVQMNSSSYVSWGNLASAQSRISGSEAEARAHYLKAISVAEEARVKAPDDPVILAVLGSYYASVGMYAKSAPLLRQASALAPDNPQILYRVAEGYELMHRREDALKSIAKAMAFGFSRETIEGNPELDGLRADRRFPVKSNQSK